MRSAPTPRPTRRPDGHHWRGRKRGSKFFPFPRPDNGRKVRATSVPPDDPSALPTRTLPGPVPLPRRLSPPQDTSSERLPAIIVRELPWS